jgi:hypothetical protein
MAAGLITA